MKSTSYFVLICLVGPALAQTRVVNTTQGPVRGYYGNDGAYFAFYGIPYATAPTGIDKFKAPMTAPTWRETFDAVRNNIICPQHHGFDPPEIRNMFDEQEDCLVANVFAPDTVETNLPVLVFIHGGGFQIGHGNMMTPKALAAKGKIVGVTFNYRLGINGFLCLGTEAAPGNAGMKDMVALLRWVKRNIASFGGNPDDVTIDGVSAGASSVDMIMLSETTKGLFKKAIAESASAICPGAVQKNPLENAIKFAKANGIDSENVYDIEKFYTTASFDVLTSEPYFFNTDSSFTFVPCVERETGVERFLKDAPYKILTSGNFEKVPLLIGYSEKEGIFRLNIFDHWKNMMNEKFSDFLPADLQFKDDEEKVAVAAQVKSFYFGDNPVSETTVENYVNYFGDVLFIYSILRTVNLHAQVGSNTVYLYEYSFFDESSRIRFFEAPVDVDGANHGVQTFAVYDVPQPPSYTESKEYAEMRETLRQTWINFIKTGQPVPQGFTVLNSTWPPAGPGGSPHMSLNRRSELRGKMHPYRMALWDQIYAKHYRTPSPPPPPPVRANSEL